MCGFLCLCINKCAELRLKKDAFAQSLTACPATGYKCPWLEEALVFPSKVFVIRQTYDTAHPLSQQPLNF